MNIHIFIISWTGQHEKAKVIEQCLSNKNCFVTVIYSDVDDNLVPDTRWVRVANENFFGQKFETALSLFNSDVMIIVTADAQSDDWRKFLDACRNAFEFHKNIGVWSPHVDFSFWSPEKTIFGVVEGTNLIQVTQTDIIVLAMSNEVVERLRLLNYKKNKFGWGVPTIACAHCHQKGRYAVIDVSVKIFHPKGTGYSKKEALAQKKDFLEQMSAAELAHMTRVVDLQRLSPQMVNFTP
jgi:hypothetical protein